MHNKGNNKQCKKTIHRLGENICKLLFLFRLWVMSDSLWPHGLQHAGLLCLSLSPRLSSNSCLLSQWCYLCHPLLPSSPPALNLSQHQGLISSLNNLFFSWVFLKHNYLLIWLLSLFHCLGPSLKLSSDNSHLIIFSHYNYVLTF